MKRKREKAVVCGTRGFIRGHLVQIRFTHGVDFERAVAIEPLEQWSQKT